MHDMAATMAAIRAAIGKDAAPDNHLRASLPALNVLLFTILGTLLAYIVFRFLAKFGFARLNVCILQDPKVQANPSTSPPSDMAPVVKRYRSDRKSTRLNSIPYCASRLSFSYLK